MRTQSAHAARVIPRTTLETTMAHSLLVKVTMHWAATFCDVAALFAAFACVKVK